MDLGLKDKIAVITGGSSGIGLAIAEGLAAEGVHLVLAARNREHLTVETSRITRSFGVRVLPVPCDVATAQGTNELLEAVAEFGGADILINNAGTGSNETVGEAPDEKWQYYWDLHVMAAVRLARGVAPGMKARWWSDPSQRLDLCGSAPLVRANLQRDQGCVDDVLKMSFDGVYQAQHSRELRQSWTGPDLRLDQNCKATHRG